MCTVTFIPANGKIYITSNRDENSKRPLAIPPASYTINGTSIIAPKDPLGGGTWIAARQDGAAIVMLNGAVEKHRPHPPYRKSRGQVFCDVAFSHNMFTAFENTDLFNIEPFTLVVWQNKKLHQLRWDGTQKQTVEKAKDSAHVWSSCTLYSSSNIAYRQSFFNQWVRRQNNIDANNILDFHLYTDVDGDAEKNIRINRNGEMITVSVSCIEIDNTGVKFNYADLVNDKNYVVTL